MPTFSQQSLVFNKPDAYNPYSMGAKRYGGGSAAPQRGAMGSQGMQGYAARDAKLQAKKNAYLKYMQALNGKDYASSAYLRGQ